jgi:uncharacterized membrane protein YqgA involved in biofilm formation
MIEKLPDIDTIALMAGVTTGEILKHHDKINELVDVINKLVDERKD